MSKNPYPSETADRFIVRFPDGMRDRIKDAAELNGRSMNAEIVHRLEASFPDAHSTGTVHHAGAVLTPTADIQKNIEQVLRQNETLAKAVDELTRHLQAAGQLPKVG